MRKKEYNKMLKESFGLISDYVKNLKNEYGYSLADLNANKDNVKSLIRNQHYEVLMNHYREEKGIAFFYEMISRGEKIHVTYKFEDEE